MHCKQYEVWISALLDHELHGFKLWRMERHLKRCALCGNQYDELSQLNKTLIMSDPVERETPTLQETSVQSGKRKGIPMRTKFLAGLAVTGALGVAFLSISKGGDANSISNRVKHAIQGENSWKMTGWKLLNGKRVDWEVTGRTKPFYFRERIGEDITVDDGAYRIRIVPGDSASYRKQDLAIRFTSQPDRDIAGLRYTRSFRDWIESRKTSGLKPETLPNGDISVIFPSDVYPDGRKERYTLNQITMLPVKYEMLNRAEQVLEYADAVYNERTLVEADEWSSRFNNPNVFMVDMTHTNDSKGRNEQISDGLKVNAIPMAMNARGEILVRVKAWLGSVPLKIPYLYMSVEPQSKFELQIVDIKLKHHTYDNRNRVYVVSTLGSIAELPNLRESAEHLILIAPLYPLRAGESLPERITLPLQIVPYINGVLSGEEGVSSGLQSPLMYKNLSFKFSTPAKAATFELNQFLTEEGRRMIENMDSKPTLMNDFIEKSRREYLHPGKLP